MIIEIDLAPPSVNTFKTFSRRGAYISPKGREYKKYVESWLNEMVQEGKIKPYTDERLKVEYEFHFKDKRKRDVDNYIKPLQDCMGGILFDDDEQIEELTAKKFYNAECNFTIIKIEEIR